MSTSDEIRDDVLMTRHPDRSDEARLAAQLAAANEELRLQIDDAAKLRNLVRLYRDERDAARGEVATFRETFQAAAGELMIPIPAPGTVEAKLLAANSIMRHQRDEWRGAAIERDWAIRSLYERSFHRVDHETAADDIGKIVGMKPGDVVKILSAESPE